VRACGFDSHAEVGSGIEPAIPQILSGTPDWAEALRADFYHHLISIGGALIELLQRVHIRWAHPMAETLPSSRLICSGYLLQCSSRLRRVHCGSTYGASGLNGRMPFTNTTRNLQPLRLR
jgi:hypothetical protein